MNRGIVITVFTLVLGSGRFAGAARGAAGGLVEGGLKLRREGETEEALDMFERAFALAPSARTVGQIGLAEASLKRWLDADEHLEASLGALKDPWVRRNKTFLEEAMELSRKHLGDITFTGPAGATVSIAGKAAGTLPISRPIRVAEGTLLIAATAVGFQQTIRSVTVPGEGHVAVALAMTPIDFRPRDADAGNASVVSLRRNEKGESSSWRAWTSGCLLLAGATAMTWGGIVAARSDDHSCPAGLSCPSTPNTRTVGWAVLGGGVAMIAAGSVVLLSGPTSEATVSVAPPIGLRIAGRY